MSTDRDHIRSMLQGAADLVRAHKQRTSSPSPAPTPPPERTSERTPTRTPERTPERTSAPRPVSSSSATARLHAWHAGRRRLTLRLRVPDHALIGLLARHMGVSRTQAIVAAVRELAARSGIRTEV